MKWTTCGDCDSEFRVISDIDTKPQYCPFCGSSVDEDPDEDEEQDEYE